MFTPAASFLSTVHKYSREYFTEVNGKIIYSWIMNANLHSINIGTGESYFSCIKCSSNLMVHPIKLNWAKKFETEHSICIDVLLYLYACPLVHYLYTHTYLHASQELHHWKKKNQEYDELLITYLLSDWLSRNKLWFDGNKQCYIWALTQILHRIITSLDSQVLFFAVAKEDWRNIHLKCTINLQHIQRSTSH